MYHKVLGRMPLFRGLSPDILIRLCQAVTPMMAVSGARVARGWRQSRRCPDGAVLRDEEETRACSVGARSPAR
eukprot:COSAG01_NODE_1526_length_10016_cov_8.480085_12_plen_73_part_00